MKKHLAILLILVIPLFVFSCGGDDNNPSNSSQSSLAGTYALQSMTLQSGGATETYRPPAITGTLTLTNNGRYALTVSVPSEDFRESASGSYTTLGGTISFRADGQSDIQTSQISVSGNTITLSGSVEESGITILMTLVFAKT